MYGLWHNDLNKWMIDKFNHETQEEDGKMTMKKTEEVKVKQYRKAKK